jgi:hypothetical protein
MRQNRPVEREVSFHVVSGASLVGVLGVLAAVVIAAVIAWPRPTAANRPQGQATAAAEPAAATRQAGAVEVIARRALALVDVPVDKVGYHLVFAPPKPGVRAQTDRATKTITVFAASFDEPSSLAHDIAHELGHAYDDRFLDDNARRAFLRTRGVPDVPWWPGAQVSDYGTGAGDFAEVFALCHARSAEFRSLLASRPADACTALAPATSKAAR